MNRLFNRFFKGQIVLHKKSKKVYVIVEEPRKDRLLESGPDGKPSMYYQYRDVNHAVRTYKDPYKLVVWNRSKQTMEDGRFISYTKPKQNYAQIKGDRCGCKPRQGYC